MAHRVWVKVVFVAGSVTGVEGALVAENQGHLAGPTAAGYLGLVEKGRMERRIAEF